MSGLANKRRQIETLKRLRSLQKREKVLAESELRKSLEDAKSKEVRAEALHQWTIRRSGYRRNAGVTIDPFFYASGLEGVEQTFSLYKQHCEKTAQLSQQREQALDELVESHAHFRLAEEMCKEQDFAKDKETQRQEFLDQCIGERGSK